MKPFFSIIIPTYNRPIQLRNCLHSLTLLDYPRNCFEVIVVNDGGETSPEAVVDPFHNQINLSFITHTQAGPAAARNSGAGKAMGEFLAFTDDDCMADPDWLKTLAARFKEATDCIIGGRTINHLTNNIYSTTSQLILDVVYGHYNAKPNQSRFFASNNMALPAHLYFTIGGFDPNFTTSEDREFCNRCLHLRFKMIYEPKAIIYHAHSLNLHTFSKQHFNYGRGAFRYHLTRLRRGYGGFFEDLKFLLNFRNWLFYPFSQVQVSQVLTLAWLLIIWQLVNAAGFFWEAGNHSIRNILRIPG
ncbi:MAG TPA: glycosyltransferase [Thermodesulfobacteriota bacterium]|nr:glycosyltransferase [Thermodesulfobacteriota bacterium]